ncbi:DNA-binding protein HU, partial [termite gut metagenome]
MNDKLNIQNIIDEVAQKHGMNKKETDAFIKELFLLIEHALEKDKIVKLKGFGTFKLINVDARESINVNTGERFTIQEHNKIGFIPET